MPLLRSCQPSAQGMQQLQNSEVVQAKEAVSWPEVEEALVLLQLRADLDVLLVASWQELTQHVCVYTKALAQLPSKQCWDSQAFSFCTAGRWAAGQQVARDGSGLRGFGGDRSGSLTGSALLWQMPLSPPSPPHAFCSRRSWPAAQNRNVWASWLTSLWRPAKADSPEGWGLTFPVASACS